MKVGILRGGTKNYDLSLRRGGEVLSHVHQNLSTKHKPVDIFVDREGVWHLGGRPIQPVDLMHKVDVIWNLMHPDAAEHLRHLPIPRVEVSHFAYVLESNRDVLRNHVKNLKINTPRSLIIPAYKEDLDGALELYAIKKAKEVFEKFGSPWMIRSYTEEKNMAIHLAKTFNELVAAIDDGARHGQSILVEEFISGKVAPVHSVTNFRGQEVYVFPPGNFSKEEKEKLVTTTKDLHRHIGGGHYLKSNFVLQSRNRVTLLGVELQPDFRQDSHFHQVCESVGVKAHQVLEHILEQALK